LVGWLEGHLRTAESALSDPHAVVAVDGVSASSDITPSPDCLHRPEVEPSGPTPVLLGGDASRQGDSATRSARGALVTAITGRITQQRLTAARAAALLHLTGPKVTKLLQGNVDEFTLDELVNLLPALELTLHVVPHRNGAPCLCPRTTPRRVIFDGEKGPADLSVAGAIVVTGPAGAGAKGDGDGPSGRAPRPLAA
jgi:predicted XRE-type DNA-binding protein